MLAVNRQTVLQTLRQRIQGLEGAERAGPTHSRSTGCAALDRLLPQGGLERGSLVEWLSEHYGGGAGTLAMLAARHAAASGELIVVSDAARRFYPPAARALGIAAEQIVVVRPANRHDELWAIDQALRCAGVAAVLAWLQKFPAQEARRLQLAAESGGTLGIFCRPAQARGQPSWANVQLLVEPQAAAVNRRLRVEVTRLRGGVAGSAVLLELDDITGQVRKASEQHDTHSLPAIPQLAAAAAYRRQA